MAETDTPALPAWATVSETQADGRITRIDVDADAMYRAWLAEFAARPADPAAFRGRRVKGGAPIPPMTAEEAVCDPARPTRYWLECAYQAMKLELQRVLGRFDFEIRVHDAAKTFAQAKWPEGRGVAAATVGFEAREHFRRLRGMLPG